MKILFDCPVPFSLAHGGAQIQIEQTKTALEKIGVEVEFLRWWDEAQSGEVLHYFSRPPLPLAQLAQKKGWRVVLADLLTAQGSRPRWQHALHGAALRILRKTLPQNFAWSLTSDSYRIADACIALTPWEARLMTGIFGAPRERVHVVPNGVEAEFFSTEKKARGPWLVCTATIAPRKRILELAEAAARARTPVWIIGKPYSESDGYFARFLQIAHAHREFIRYEGAVNDRARLAAIYREARGFVLLSAMESLSLSALEAAACECPLLLSDLPWARTVFGDRASYCPITSQVGKTAAALRKFCDAAPSLPLPPKPAGWIDVARQLKTIYEKLGA